MISAPLPEGLHISPHGIVAVLPKGAHQGLFEMSPARMIEVAALLKKRAKQFRRGEVPAGTDFLVNFDG